MLDLAKGCWLTALLTRFAGQNGRGRLFYRFASLVLALFGAGAAAAQPALPPAGGAGHGFVAVELEEFDALRRWSQGDRWVARNAACRIAVRSSVARLDYEVEGELRDGEEPQALPLPSGELVPLEAWADGARAELLPEAGGGKAILVSRPGAHALTASFELPVTRRGSLEELQLAVPLVALTRVEALLPPNLERVASPDLLIQSRQDSDAGTRIAGVLLPTGRLALRWRPRGGEAPASAPGPARLDLSVSLGGSRPQGRLSVAVSGDDRFELQWPSGWRLLSVFAEGTTSDLPHRLLAGGGGRRLLVGPVDELTGVAAASIRFSVELPPGSAPVRLAVPAVLNAGTQTGSLLLSEVGRGALTPGAAEGLTRLDASTVRELSLEGEQPAEVGYEYREVPAALVLQRTGPDRSASGPARISRLLARSRIGPDGAVLTTLRCEVTEGAPGLIELSLPEGPELLAAFEDGRSLAIGTRGRRAAIGTAGGSATSPRILELVLAHRPEASGILSTTNLAIPTLSAEVGTLYWDLVAQADGTYRVEADELEPVAVPDRRAALLDPHGEARLDRVRAGAGLPGPAPLPDAGESAAGPASLVAAFQASTFAPGSPARITVLRASGGLVRGLETVVFLLASGLPLLGILRRAAPRKLPLTLLPAVLVALVSSPVVPAAWQPLASGLTVALAVALLGYLASGPDG